MMAQKTARNARAENYEEVKEEKEIKAIYNYSNLIKMYRHVL